MDNLGDTKTIVCNFCHMLFNGWIFINNPKQEKYLELQLRQDPLTNVQNLSSKQQCKLCNVKEINLCGFNELSSYTDLQAMGSSHAKPAANAAASTDTANTDGTHDLILTTNTANSSTKTKSRYGTRGKVFGRFTQKKAPKEQLTPVSMATAGTLSSLTTDDDDMGNNSKDKIEQLILLQQQQQQVYQAKFVRQLEHQQLNFYEIEDAADYCLYKKMQLTGSSMHDDDVVVLKEMSSSSDSLFTDPLSPRVSNHTNEALTIEQSTAEAKKLNNFTCQSNQERPVSIFSTTTYDTSGILSPTTARAVAELKLRHRADKLSQLSISKTTYLALSPANSIPNDASSVNTESSDDGPDELMALQLSKKLTQVLHNNNSTEIGNEYKMNSSDNNITSNVVGMDIFNISKAKKIELRNLSSCFTASSMSPTATTSTTSLGNLEAQTNLVETQDVTHNFSTVNCDSLQWATTESAAAQIVSPTPATPTTIFSPVTPSSNVLKKVASFTVEKNPGTLAVSSSGGNIATGSAIANSEILRRFYVSEKLSFAAYEKFEGQMLMKWLISSFQTNNNLTSSLNEHELNILTAQYCNNLMKIGVLKKISEKNEEEIFSPYEMYQWTHTEAPTTSLPLTPGKLDKATVWPYVCTPTDSQSLRRSAQVDEGVYNSQWLQVLKRRLLNCVSMQEVQLVVEDFLNIEDVQLEHRRPSKRCIQLTELLNENEDAAEYEKNSNNRQALAQTCEKKNIEVQTEPNEICCICRQQELNKKNNSAENQKQSDAAPVPAPAMPAPPPPPPPPPLLAPPPPPPAPPIPPPPPAMFSDSAAAPASQTKQTVPAPPPPPQAAAGKANNVPPPPPSAPIPPPPPPNLAINNNGIANAPKPPPPCPTPTPLPNPTECGWFQQGNNLRKHAVNPPKPMKPLYWTRIVTPLPPAKPIKPAITPTDTTDSSVSSPEDILEETGTPKEIWQEIEETNLDNIDEFTELFSRQAQAPVSKPKEQKEVRVRTIKVLDSKRSQNVGIVSRSLHVDFCEIEHAIYHVDTSVVSLETLQHIINIKATNEELELIKEAALSDVPLDYPEQFLLRISQISMSTERISCIVFQAEFEEATTIIFRKLEIVTQLSQYMIESEDLKLVFSIILTLGNYMNGGNRHRGQADGFTLEILGKLKDVKSKESNTTLLHFIVRTYIARRRKEGVEFTEMILPIPEPADVERATQVDFDDLKKQITDLSRKLKTCKKTREKVIQASTKDTLQPFKDKMEEFIETAVKTVEKLFKDLDECRDTFIETMRFYHFTPKSRTLEESTPDQFFEYWTNFTNDFKDIWKKEIAMLWNELMKKSKKLQTERKNIKTTKVKPGGLKERIMRLSKK